MADSILHNEGTSAPRKGCGWLTAPRGNGKTLVATAGNAHLFIRRLRPEFEHAIILVLEKIPEPRGVPVRKHGGLTKRENEVLHWLAHAKSDAQIASILGISRRTVGKHLERIYPKLGVESRTAAATHAER